MTPFLALITPLGQQPPSSPPGFWGGSSEPFPGWGLPPAGPGRPPGTWGGAGEPFPGYGLPGRPPGVWGPPGPWPQPPIHLPPAQPPGTWGGAGEPFPGYGLPPPIFIWGPGDPRPQPPIHLPDLPEPPEVPGIDWKVGWTPSTGWIVVGVPTGPHPAPSGS